MLGLTLMLVLVVFGSAFQVVTGLGLGLIAGPSLLFFLDTESAIQVAIVLNLLLTLCLLYPDRAHVSKPWLFSLSAWALIGIPIGFVLMLFVPQGMLKIFASLFILFVVIQLKYFPAKPVENASIRRARFGCIVSGMFAGALAAPGPAALWTLLSHKVSALAARATIRYYFIVAYGAALLIHWAGVGLGDKVVATLKLLVPAMVGGMLIGLVLRTRFSPTALMSLFEVILFFSGASLLIKGVLDVV